MKPARLATAAAAVLPGAVDAGARIAPPPSRPPGEAVGVSAHGGRTTQPDTERAAPDPLAAAEPLDAPPAIEGLAATDPLIREAVRAAAARVAASPDTADAWMALARVCHANGFVAEARTCYRQALRRDPDRADAAYLLALLEHARANAGHAIALADHAATIEPGYAPAHWRAGFWLLDQGRADAAARRFERALSANPDEEAALFGLARARIMQRRPEDAVRILEEDLAGAANAAYRDGLLAAAFRRAGRAEDAARLAARVSGAPEPSWKDPWYREAMEHKTGFLGEMERAERLIDARRYEEAIAILTRLRRRHREAETLLINLAVAQEGLGRRDEAIATLRAVLDFKPDSYLAHQNLGAVLLADALQGADTADRAIAHIQRAISANPRAARAHVLKGDYLRWRGRPDDAARAYARAAEIEPRRADALHKLATVHAKAGRLDRALAALLRLVAVQPDNVAAWVNIALIHAHHGRAEAAQRALDTARERHTKPHPGFDRVQERIDQLKARQAGDG